MINQDCVNIDILGEIPLLGVGQTLESKLRKVTLEGFPSVHIYESAKFEARKLSAKRIREEVSTTQPYVFADLLRNQENLANLFARERIDIFNLQLAYDYYAISNNGKKSLWTITPPILEEINIPLTSEGNFDYQPLLGKELRDRMYSEGIDLKEIIAKTPHHNDFGKYLLLIDGSHRTFLRHQEGLTFLAIKNINSGFPYIALPRPYQNIKVVPTYNDKPKDSKIKIFSENCLNYSLFRSFSSAGIFSGEARAYKTGKN